MNIFHFVNTRVIPVKDFNKIALNSNHNNCALLNLFIHWVSQQHNQPYERFSNINIHKHIYNASDIICSHFIIPQII